MDTNFVHGSEQKPFIIRDLKTISDSEENEGKNTFGLNTPEYLKKNDGTFLIN